MVFSVLILIHKAEHRKLGLKLRDNTLIASKLLQKIKDEHLAYAKLYGLLEYALH